MKILLSSMELFTLTGQPMYTYHLAKGFVEMGHEVVVVSEITGGEMKKKFDDIGVRHYYLATQAYHNIIFDLAIVSEQNSNYVVENIKCKKIFNLMHSKHRVDAPIKNDKIAGYVAPRQQILDHHKVEGTIIPIPVDMDKLKVELVPHDCYRIIAPCTREPLRKPMLMNLIERAVKGVEVWMVGKEYGALDGVKLPKNVKVFNETPDIIDYMKQCDEVAGIFEGTVSYEGAAMGLKTSIYDEYGNWEYKTLIPTDYKDIAKQYINLCNTAIQQQKKV